jgi:hypothetical protein
LSGRTEPGSSTGTPPHHRRGEPILEAKETDRGEKQTDRQTDIFFTVFFVL